MGLAPVPEKQPSPRSLQAPARASSTGLEAGDTDLGAELRRAGDEQQQQEEERAGAGESHLAGGDPSAWEGTTLSGCCRVCPAGAERIQPMPSAPSPQGPGGGSAAGRLGGERRGAQLSRCAPPGAPAATSVRGPAVGAREGGAGPQAGKEEGPPGQECAWSAPSPSRRRRDARTWTVGSVQGPGEGAGSARSRSMRPGRARTRARPPDRPLRRGETAADHPPLPTHSATPTRFCPLHSHARPPSSAAVWRGDGLQKLDRRPTKLSIRGGPLHPGL